MTSPNARVTEILYEELDLCEVSEGERVVLLTQPGSRDDYKQGFLTACQLLGATCVAVELPGVKHELFPYEGQVEEPLDEIIESLPGVKEHLARADVIIDITTTDVLLFSESMAAALERDARILMVRDPPEVLERMFPTEELRQRVERAVAMIAGAETMRFTSESGTDVTIHIDDEAPVVGRHGYAAQPGRRDHLPAGFVATYPRLDERMTGRITIDPGDVLAPPLKYLDNHVDVRFENGYVTDINGEGADADLFEGYLATWDDETAYGASHFGFGLNENAVWEALEYYRTEQVVGQDTRSHAGNFQWSLGPNPFVDRTIRAHVDIHQRNCSVYLDGERIIRTGEIVEPSLQP